MRNNSYYNQHTMLPDVFACAFHKFKFAGVDEMFVELAMLHIRHMLRSSNQSLSLSFFHIDNHGRPSNSLKVNFPRSNLPNSSEFEANPICNMFNKRGTRYCAPSSSVAWIVQRLMWSVTEKNWRRGDDCVEWEVGDVENRQQTRKIEANI